MSAVPEAFPCMRALAAGEFAVLAGDVIYCRDCYSFAETMSPSLHDVSEGFQFKRGVTCGGGQAED